MGNAAASIPQLPRKAPPGGLVFRPSTGLQFGYHVARVKNRLPASPGQHFELLPVEAHQVPRNPPVLLHQEKRRHTRNAERIARRIAVLFAIEQRRDRQAELLREAARRRGLVLRYRDDLQIAAGHAAQGWQFELEGRSGILEKRQQDRAGGEQTGWWAPPAFGVDERHIGGRRAAFEWSWNTAVHLPFSLPTRAPDSRHESGIRGTGHPSLAARKPQSITSRDQRERSSRCCEP